MKSFFLKVYDGEWGYRDGEVFGRGVRERVREMVVFREKWAGKVERYVQEYCPEFDEGKRGVDFVDYHWSWRFQMEKDSDQVVGLVRDFSSTAESLGKIMILGIWIFGFLC